MSTQNQPETDRHAALEDLRRAAEASPRDCAARLELGKMLWRRKRHDEAARELSRALALRPADPLPVLEARAGVYWAMGKARAALRDLKRCIRLSPVPDHFRLKAARVALHCGDERFLASTLAAWDRARDGDGRQRAEFIRGLRAFAGGRYAEAASAFSASGELGRSVAQFSYASMAEGLAAVAGTRA